MVGLCARLHCSGVRLLVMTLVLCSGQAYADDTVEPLDYECERERQCMLTAGRRGPSDPHWQAELQRELARLRITDTVEKTAPEPENIGLVATTQTFKPKVPDWPHSVSIGSAARGWLANAETLDESPRIWVRVGRHYGTREMVTTIRDAIDAVHEKYPNTPRLAMGDLTKKHGGRFRPHVSHQSGRDADIGYYMTKGHHTRLLKRATWRTLDLPRTWVFIESMFVKDKVEYIFMDYRLMGALFRYARDVIELSDEKLVEYFAYPNGRKARVGIIRHLRGHADHMHVRFHAPDSIAAVKEYVRRHGRQVLKPLPVYTRIRRGDSLWKIARRHRVTINKLTRWNRISRRKILRPGSKLVVGWRPPTLPTFPGS